MPTRHFQPPECAPAPPRTGDVRRMAEEAFDSGLHCAEAVASALTCLQGIDAALATRMASAFGSGMSLTRGPCGALTGAVIGLALCLGRSDARQSLAVCQAATRDLVNAFEREFGARDCARLLDCDIATAEGRVRFQKEALYHRCERYTVRAAEIAASLLALSGADLAG
jgi:C_GCAxxG_C_C family probable redox protein